MSRGKELVRIGEKEQGIRALAPAHESSIGDNRWHAVEASIEATLSSLRHRDLPELLGALGQIEQYLQDLAPELGQVKEVLDLPPVGKLMRFISILLEKRLPALHTYVRRAELRDEAAPRLAALERVHEKLVNLREELTARIDDAVAERCSTEDGNRSMHEYYRVLRGRIDVERGNLARIKDVLKMDLLQDSEAIFRNENVTKILALVHIYKEIGRTDADIKKVARKEKIKIRRIHDLGEEYVDVEYVSMTYLRSKFIELQAVVEACLAGTQREIDGLLARKRQELLERAGMAGAAALLEEVE